MYTSSFKVLKGEDDIACCILAALLVYFGQNIRNTKKLGDMNRNTHINLFYL